MKPKLKIQFTDFWPDFNREENLFINLLKNDYEVELSDKPDILFYSVYDFNFINYNCPKIYYTAENTRPNFRECDFAISFDYDPYKGRNLRMPLYRWRGDLKNLCLEKNPETIASQKSKFACMVVSNGACKERNRFFELLSQYKKVDSGGRYLNNIGGPVADKIAFIKDYKFVLSFENSSYPGYTTEKIVEPMIVNSLPVYWGNPEIQRDFNPASFINVHDYPSFEEAVEAIVRIDKDDELYKTYLKAPYFKENKFPQELEFNIIGEKLFQSVERLLNSKPISNSTLYRPFALGNKYRRKLLSKIYGKPHFYF